MRPVRVAYVAPTLQPGGAERQMLTLAAALPRPPFAVQFLLMSDRGPLADEAEALGIRVTVLGMGRGTGIRSFVRLIGAVPRYLRVLRGVDIVDAWLVPAWTFAGILQPLTRVPVLVAGRRNRLNVHRTRSWHREAAGAVAGRRVMAIVANSQAAADDAIIYEHIDAGRVHVIRNAVVPRTAVPGEREAHRKLWCDTPDELVVGCVANYSQGKGHSLLLDAAQALQDQKPKVRFVLVGGGHLRPALEHQIHVRGLAGSVVLHSGEVDARRVYSAFDISVQVSESEGLPNAVLEAAAAGRPIVATDVGGTREIITSDVDGILVPAGDVPALVHALRRLIDDPALRLRLGSAAALRAMEFSPLRLAQETGSLYLRLLGRDPDALATHWE